MFWRRNEAVVPILAWHSMQVSSSEQAGNDHVLFREDLETLHGLGLRVVSLARIAEAHRRDDLASLAGCVGLSFDDGSDFDYYDVPHPVWGPQRGMIRILEDFQARHGRAAQPGLHATSFTIVSPQARHALDRTCMVGCRWWNDAWYPKAEASGVISMESHSWDHNHPTLQATAIADRDGFNVATPEEAEVEIAQAARELRRLRGRAGDVLLAYPYGPVPTYLASEWLPKFGEALGIPAAFSGNDTDPVHRKSSRWALPRFTAQHQWKSSQELAQLLREAGAVTRRLPATRQDVAETAPAERAIEWRDCFRTWEVNDVSKLAGDLFRKSFGTPPPDYPRHFVLVYSPPPGAEDTTPRVVAYVHQRPHEDFWLGGGMCVDERAYRKLPRALFAAVRDEGGLATIVTRDSVRMLGEDAVVSFGYVGDAKARAADLRTGYVDTGVEHLMAMWLKEISEPERQSFIARAAKVGPF